MAMKKLSRFNTALLVTGLGFLFLSFRSRTVRFEPARDLVTAKDPLRVAVFGSSHSWGANLEERFKAYPYRLSPTVDNFAYFASGTNHYSFVELADGEQHVCVCVWLCVSFVGSLVRWFFSK